MIRSILFVASAVLLSSCSGGGGDGGSTTGVSLNSAPVLSSGNADQAAQVGYEFSYDATQNGGAFSDPDGSALTYSVAFNPTNGLTAAAGVVSGTPSTGGDITVTVTATDAGGLSASDSFIVAVTIDQNAVQAEFGGSIDLENLENYADQTVPAYIEKLNDGGNPISDAGATLGRVLFYDTSLSIDGTVSCATCHAQSLAFGDAAIVSTGVEGGLTGRHSMRLINTMFADEADFFWDERAPSHEAQESQPIQDHNEMGFSGQAGRPDLAVLISQMEATEYYEELFRFAFLDPEINEAGIQIALAQFTKSIHSFDSRYDTGRAQVNNNNADFPNFSGDENAGKTLFMTNANNGGAGCNSCHRAPEFDIAPNSDQNGIFAVAGSLIDFDLTNTRAPTLRDLVGPGGTSNGPFMHDGSLPSLRSVIDHYDSITEPTSEPPLSEFLDTLDNRLSTGGTPQRLNLTETEKQQLEDFLRTLTGVNVYSDSKWSDPF